MREHIPRPVRLVLSPLRQTGTSLLRRGLRVVAQRATPAADYGWVFVVTYGRSGSTLLTGLLNAIPGYRIRGENYNTLYRLYQADAAAASAKSKFSSADDLVPHSGWYGAPLIREHAYRAGLVGSFIEHVLRPAPGDRVLGFKEIRYTPVHMADLKEFLQFIREAFPGARIVFNHRDPEAVARSGWWTGVQRATEKIRDADARLREFPPDRRHFHFEYDRIAEGLDHIRELHDFLGESFDEAAVRRVLGKRHSVYPS